MSKALNKRDQTQPALPADLARAAQAAFGKKATDVVVLDLRKVPSFTDYFFICTGQNRRQVKAVADAVEMTLGKAGVKPAHVEGHERSDWILLDYFDFVVHVFTAEQRRFYSLERLWGSAARIDVPDVAA